MSNVKDKKYEEALERARQGLPIDEVFPELKESKDERIRKSLVDYFRKFKPQDMWDEMFSIGDVISCLESQKENQPAEWSEKDETFLEDALWCILLIKHFVPKYVCNLDTRISVEKWLKSLPKRLKSLRPQSHWTPSEEQMKALAWYSGNYDVPPTGDKAIKSLYNDLQKLP